MEEIFFVLLGFAALAVVLLVPIGTFVIVKRLERDQSERFKALRSELKKIGGFEAALLDYMANSQGELLAALDGGDWNDDLEAQLAAAVEEFKSTGTW